MALSLTFRCSPLTPKHGGFHLDKPPSTTRTHVSASTDHFRLLVVSFKKTFRNWLQAPPGNTSDSLTCKLPVRFAFLREYCATRIAHRNADYHVLAGQHPAHAIHKSLACSPSPLWMKQTCTQSPMSQRERQCCQHYHPVNCVKVWCVACVLSVWKNNGSDQRAARAFIVSS